MNKVTLITGASEGIGAELARVFAAHGHTTVLVARRQDKLEALRDEITQKGHPCPIILSLDLVAEGASETLELLLREQNLEPSVLVNNAGFGLLGEASALPLKDQLEMIDLNIRCLTDLSLRFIDSLTRHKGKILNVASIAAFLPGPNMAVYYASKAYVLSFSHALGHELKNNNIQVSVLCPGPVPTGFQQRAGIVTNTAPSLLTLDAKTTAQIAYQDLMCGKPVIIPGLGNKLFTRLVRFLPVQWLMTQIAKYQSGRM